VPYNIAQSQAVSLSPLACIVTTVVR